MDTFALHTSAAFPGQVQTTVASPVINARERSSSTNAADCLGTFVCLILEERVASSSEAEERGRGLEGALGSTERGDPLW